jgi:uncharacterized membrane protein YjjB (DUF3815 family)
MWAALRAIPLIGGLLIGYTFVWTAMEPVAQTTVIPVGTCAVIAADRPRWRDSPLFVLGGACAATVATVLGVHLHRPTAWVASAAILGFTGLVLTVLDCWRLARTERAQPESQ